MDPSDFEDILMPFFDHPGIIRMPDRELETNPRCALTVVLEIIHETQPECKPNPDRLPDAVFETAKKRVLALPEFKHLAGYPQTGPAIVERIVDLALNTLLEAHIVLRRSSRLVTAAAHRADVEARNYRRLYLQMFRVLANDVLWAMPIDVALFEDYFGFTLLQLARSGGEPTHIGQFTREFYTALPTLYALASAGYENPSGDEAATCYAIGVLYCFWGLLGLVDIEPSGDAHRNRLDHIVTARPLLGELVTFPREWVHPVVNPSAPDFDGLSPNAMHALIYEPFNSPDIISYAGSAASTSAPILVVLEEVIRAGETGGLKATGTGAFPRAFVQDIGPRVRSAYEL